MKIGRFGPLGSEVPVVVAVREDGSEAVYDARGITQDIDGAFLEQGGIDRLRTALHEGCLKELENPDGLRVGSPIARPNNIICVGMNYAAHARESGAEPPTSPVIFMKPANTIAGPFDAAPIPPLSSTYDWEVEVGIVIGRRASYLNDLAQAEDVVAGYVLANDLSERENQLNAPGGQWTKGKSFPSSTPVGPWLVPADLVNVSELGLRSWVNGEARQDSTAADLIFDVATVVHHISQYLVLEPGDLILTGTPEGVGLSGRFPYIQDGDTVTLEAGILGQQKQVFFRTQTATTLGA